MTRWQQFTGVPIWITVIAACLVAGSGIVVLAHLISSSYAGIPDKRALLASPRAAGEAANKVQDASPQPPTSAVGHVRKACAGCGVVESVRMIAGGIDSDGRDHLGPRAANAMVRAPNTRYEYTVRFRDGSTSIFNEATPRNWRAGNRVIVIDGAHPAIR